MDGKQILALVSAIASIAAGSGWYGARQDFDRAAAKYRAAKELGRACMGDEAFAVEWAEVLADIREAEGGE